MANIQIMDAHLANLIAAGEVVERPSSVVKELVENAIDAGSTRIEVHLEEGGLQLIRIVDNGAGMDKEDCRLAFERHATSKLKKERELPHIRTLGFRGEAIPSIAAVSRMEIKSALKGEPMGTRILMVGGEQKEFEPVAFPRGTEVRVADLFYNTPARLKYMKTIHTEVGHVSDMINRLALSHPEISFLLIHNGKQMLKTSGDGQLLHVIAAVYGMSIARSMVKVEAESLDFTLSGYVAKPEFTRANRSYISTLINGRYIRNIGLNHAILRGYHTLLPINRYPITVLSVGMDPSLVDVNVHPAKLEVRFSKEQELYEFVEQEIKQVWGKERLIPEPGRQQTNNPRPKNKDYQASMDWTLFVPSKEEAAVPVTEDRVEEWKEEKSRPLPDPQTEAAYVPQQEAVYEADMEAYLEKTVVDESYTRNRTPYVERSGEQDPAPAIESKQTERVEERKETGESGGMRVPEMYPMAQLHGTYILAQSQDGMYMIDQHAAQERIFYEYFLNKLRSEAIESQDLLLPITLELTVAEAVAVEEHRDWFAQIGVYMEPFGTNSYIIRSHPRWLLKGEEEAILHEMVSMVLESKKGIDVVKLREAAAITMSCKAAIKANRHLNHAEMEALIERLRRTTSPFTCPHGRPIIIHFSTYDIEKMFKRVM
jgi:DNA mismatch repair protein MutL